MCVQAPKTPPPPPPPAPAPPPPPPRATEIAAPQGQELRRRTAAQLGTAQLRIPIPSQLNVPR